MTKKAKLFISLAVAIILLAVGLILLNSEKDKNNLPNNPIGGGEEVPISVDSYDAKFNKTVFASGINVVPLTIVEDSRCPIDVQCIQAGTVRINVRIFDDVETVEKILTLGQPIFFGDVSILLKNVLPAPESKKTITADDYIFTFEIKNRTASSIDGLPESSKVPNAPTNFAKAGVITLNNPGQEKEIPYIVYEEPGKSALSKKLVFDEESTCATPNGSAECMAISVGVGRSYQGKKVTVEGLSMKDYVIVRLLRAFDEKDNLVAPKTGDLILSWRSAVKLIETCAVSSVFQSHARDVSILLKDGRRVRSVEPMVDDLIGVVNKATVNCGQVMIGTE